MQDSPNKRLARASRTGTVEAFGEGKIKLPAVSGEHPGSVHQHPRYQRTSSPSLWLALALQFSIISPGAPRHSLSPGIEAYLQIRREH